MAHLPKGQGVFLPPFKAWLASNIPAVYDNTMTYYEELCALIKYLQDVVIPALNHNAEAVTTISTAVEQLQKYVEDYFKNLDVQEEINNKLDEMVEDGTLQKIIGDYLDQIQSRVTALEKTVEPLPDIAKEPLFLSCFFNRSSKLQFYVTRDLKNYSLLSGTGDITARDSSMVEYDGYIYIASTYQTDDADFMIRKTKDLVNFEEYPINLGLDKTKNRWAPSIMVKDDKFIVTITLRTASGLETATGEIYRTEGTISTLEFTTPSKITSITQTKAMDSDLFKHGDLYYLFVKDDEYDLPKTYLYKSTDSRTFEYVREMTEFPSSVKTKVEGVYGVSLGNKVFVSGDNYDNMTFGSAVQLGLFTTDIENASKNGVFTCNNGSSEWQRHGYSILVNSLNLKAEILSKQNTIAGEHRYEMLIDLSRYADENNVVDDLYIYPNVVYFLAGNKNITINKLHNPFQCDTAHFQFRQAIGTSLTIVNNGYTTKNYKWVNSLQNYENDIILVNTTEGFVPIAGYQNAYVINATLEPITANTNLTTDDNNVYRLGSGTYTITLSGRASKVFFRKNADVTGTVTITDGYYSYTLNLSDYKNNSFIEFIHVVNNWYMVN